MTQARLYSFGCFPSSGNGYGDLVTLSHVHSASPSMSISSHAGRQPGPWGQPAAACHCGIVFGWSQSSVAEDLTRYRHWSDLSSCCISSPDISFALE